MPPESQVQTDRESARSTSRVKAWWNGASASAGSRVTTTAPQDKSTDSSAATDGYVPLKERLAAWWNGQEEQSGGPHDPSMEIVHTGETDGSKTEWSESRIRLSRALWGGGFIRPGSGIFANHLMAQALLNPQKTILDISPGLGGTALRMVESKKVWIEAIESNASLAHRAQLFLAEHKFGNQVDLRYEDFAKLVLPPLRYHIIYGREYLYTLATKEPLLKQVCRSLKDDGQLLLFDYMIRDGAQDNALIAEWRNIEPCEVHPWTNSKYQAVLQSGGLSIRSCEDFSMVMAKEIKKAWQQMLKNLQTGEVKPTDVDNILDEGNLWQARLKALEAGDLQLLRIEARKSLTDVKLDSVPAAPPVDPASITE